MGIDHLWKFVEKSSPYPGVSYQSFGAGPGESSWYLWHDQNPWRLRISWAKTKWGGQQKPRISKTEPGKLWGQQNRICSYYSLIKPEILYTFEVLWCFFLFLHLWLHYPSPYPLMYHWPSFAQCQPSANPTCCGLGCGTKRASHSGSAGFLRAPKIRGPSDPKKSLRKPAVQQTLTLTVSWSSCHRWLHGISGCFCGVWSSLVIPPLV